MIDLHSKKMTLYYYAGGIMKTKAISNVKADSVKVKGVVSFKDKINGYISDLAQIVAPSMFMANGSYVSPSEARR